MELQNLQENYLDAIEKASFLDKEVQTANEKIDSLQKLIRRLHSNMTLDFATLPNFIGSKIFIQFSILGGEEIASMKAQLAQKNQLLTKVKVLLEKAAMREKELIEKVTRMH